MSLAKRLERLEATVRAKNPGREFYPCCRVIYDPKDWDIGEEEAISRMKAEELDRLEAAGRISHSEREHVDFIVRTIVSPPERNEEAVSQQDL